MHRLGTALLALLLFTDVAQADFHGLLNAARTGSAELVAAALAAGDDPNPPTWHEGYAPLQFAARHGDVEIVRQLLAAGADTEYRDHNGDRALLWAAREGHAEVIGLLLAAGSPPDTEADPYGRTPLMLAASHNSDAAAVLVKAGADVHRFDQSGVTALHIAAAAGNDALVASLLASGANPNVVSRSLLETPLHRAAWADSAETVRLLGRAGAEWRVPDHRGMLPLHVAAARGRLDNVLALLDFGWVTESRDGSGRTPLIVAIEAIEVGFEGAEAVALALADRTRARDDAFIAALREGVSSVALRLLELGVDSNAVDARGDSVLGTAAGLGHLPLLEAVIAQGADLATFGPEALATAAAEDHLAAVHLLLEHGIAPDARTSEGATALLHAARNGAAHSFALLLDLGADPTAKDAAGRGIEDYLQALTGLLDIRIGRHERSAAVHPESAELAAWRERITAGQAEIRALLAGR